MKSLRNNSFKIDTFLFTSIYGHEMASIGRSPMLRFLRCSDSMQRLLRENYVYLCIDFWPKEDGNIGSSARVWPF